MNLSVYSQPLSRIRVRNPDFFLRTSLFTLLTFVANRDGSWNNDAANCRTANCNTNDPTNHTNNDGFRQTLSSAGMGDHWMVLVVGRMTESNAPGGLFCIDIVQLSVAFPQLSQGVREQPGC